MLLGVFIICLILVGFFGGFFACRFFVKRGQGIMAICGTCKYKCACADYVPANLGQDEI